MAILIDIETYNANFAKTLQSPPKYKKEWEKRFKEMSVHMRGDVPVDLIETRRPNEEEAVKEFRKEVYQPITKSVFKRSLNKIQRIFAHANYSPVLPRSLSDYLKSHTFNNQPFDEFVSQHVIRRMIEDPNGYLVWLPGGKGITDPTKQVDPHPVMIYSRDIVYVDDDVITWKESDDLYRTLTIEGYYQHIRDTKDKTKYYLEVIYEHQMGMLPAIVLGGEAEEEGYYESFFNAAIPFANEAARQFSDWQAVMITSAFPYRTETFTECDYPKCMGQGWWYTDENNDEIEVCPVCKGTGHKPHTSPYGVFIREQKQLGETQDTSPLIEFTSPASDILEFSGKTWRDLLLEARKALHDDIVDEAQSGVAKIVDREDFYAFLSQIAENVYDSIIQRSLEIIYHYIDINGSDEIIVTKPASFTVKTEQDLVEELGIMMEKKAPVTIVKEVLKDLTKKRFGDNKLISRKTDFLLTFDPLITMDMTIKSQLAAAGYDDLVKASIYAPQIIDEMLIDNPDLFSDGYNYKKVKDELLKRLSEIQVTPARTQLYG